MNSTEKKIGFIINALTYGGAERVFADDANSLSGEGYGVTLFILYGGEEKSPLAAELAPSVSVEYLRAAGPYDVGAVSRCARMLQARDIGILFSTLNDGNIFARWVAIRTGARLFAREANTLASKTFFQKALDFLFGWVPFRYLAVSKEVRDSLARLVWYARGRIILFPNAVAVPPDAPRASRPTPRIVAVGRLTEQKDFETLIRALSALKRNGTPFRAAIIGDGLLRSTLEAQIRDERLNAEVTLTGRRAHERVLEAYRDADIFVSSSRWEGSPNALLEAMAYGLACVSTAVGGVVDIVTDGEDGFLVRPGDPEALASALKKACESAELREKLGRAARRRIEETFSRGARFQKLRALIGAA